MTPPDTPGFDALYRLTRQLGRILIEQDESEMRNSDQEIQGVPTEQVNRVRMALVESTSNVGTVDSQSSTIQNKQIKWWVSALPVLVLIFITAAHFLSTPVAARAEAEKSWLDDPVLLAVSTSSKGSPDKFPLKGHVSGIAYSENHALAFIDDKVISEGGVIDGVTVFKIHEDTVEFEKDGKRWTQKVGE